MSKKPKPVIKLVNISHKKKIKDGIIFLTPAFVTKIWGSQRLKTDFNFPLPNDKKIGEAWLISALPQAMSYVANGEYKDLSLKELYQNHPILFGYPKSTEYPLLSKILDANDNLSVQFHPDDNYAQQHHQSFGKTECWYILDCPTNQEVIYGHNAKNKTELLKWLDEKNFNQLLKKIPIQRDQFIYVPALKIHGLLANTVVFELQQSADVTYRLYDYNRPDLNGMMRKLNLSEARTLIMAPDQDTSSANSHDNYLVDNQFFKLIKIENNGNNHYHFPNAPWIQASVIKGKGTIDGISIEIGVSFILPNQYQDFYLNGEMTLMVSHV